MQVARWGNSLAIRLPAKVVHALGLKPGDDVEIDVIDARHLSVARSPDSDALMKRVRAMRGTMPKDFKFDRHDANRL